jgi:hypothetical protein
MPKLLSQLLARRGYMNPEPGAEGGGAADTPPVEPSADLLEEHGMTAEEFKALPAHEQAALAADTSDSDDLTGEDMQRASDAPAPTPAPSPAPSPAPTPAPAPAAAAPNPEPGSGSEPAATPAPTPAPAPAQTWRAVVDESLALNLPEVALPPAPAPRLTKEDIAARDAAKAEIDKLEAQFDEGELTAAQFREQRAVHEKKIEEVRTREAADLARQEMYRDAVDGAFGQAVNASLDQAKAAGLDYRAPENKDKLAELDRRTSHYAQAAQLMFPGKPGHWYDRWGLDRAHQEVAAKYGITLGKAPAPGPAAGPAPSPAPAARQAPDLSKLPPTTRNAPNAADPAIGGGEFSHLDSLTGADLERALARLTPEQMDRYLS